MPCRPSSRPPESGADQIELDVHLSADGELMVIHDATPRRDHHWAMAPVSRLTLAELKQIRLRTVDEPIPTLDDVLDAVGTRIHTRIEIKRDARRQRLCRPCRKDHATPSKAATSRTASPSCASISTPCAPFAGVATKPACHLRAASARTRILTAWSRRLADEGIADIGYFFHELTAERHRHHHRSRADRRRLDRQWRAAPRLLAATSRSATS